MAQVGFDFFAAKNQTFHALSITGQWRLAEPFHAKSIPSS